MRPTEPGAMDLTMHEPLQQTLRALWGLETEVLIDAELPHLSERRIHLPRHAPEGADALAWRRAAAAHAAAHLVYSPPVLDGRGLRPIVRAIVGVLEDARVEALAVRELPGLQRWWRARHTVTPDDGEGVEVLLLRLARALADAAYEDPHPWVRKGRALFYLDAAGSVLAEPRAERLREMASRLGHDLGQMRLQFHAKGYRPGPDYRDDHRWMWPEQASETETMRPAPPPPGRAAPSERIDDDAPRHPEWDRLIARLRPAWCRVVEEAASSPDEAVPPPATTTPRPAWRRALLSRRASGPWRASHDGPHLDLDALLRLRVSHRGGREGDDRIHRTRSRRQRIGSALLLIDQSASTAAPTPGGDFSQLEAARTMAWQAAQALRGAGLVTAIAAFSSNGRHAVSWRPVQRFGEPLSAPCHARLAGLRSGGSTRLGAAIRHGARELARRPDGERVLLVISDGQPHDIDVHDPRYLVEDARHAVRSARRQGLTVTCLSLDAGSAPARRIFGAADLR